MNNFSGLYDIWGLFLAVLSLPWGDESRWIVALSKRAQ